VFLLFVVLTFLGESFAGSGLFMLPLVEEDSLVEAFVDLFLFVIVTSTSTCEMIGKMMKQNKMIPKVEKQINNHM
jgi:hypothetical protein